MRTKRFVVLATCAAFLSFQGLASADLITTGSWFMDQSNALPDGVNYGQVDITANATSGLVQFLVTAFTAPYSGIGSNFGIQAFGFNLQNLTSTPNPTLPSGWSQSASQQMDGFGTFSLQESGTGSTRQNPLSFNFTLPTASEAIASNFALNSTGNAGEGNVFFAAHVAGFTVQGTEITSHFIGGSTQERTPPVPAPAAAVLGLIGMALTGSVRRWLA